MKPSSQLLLVSKSWKFHEHSSICYSIMLVTNTDTENRKMSPVFKGLNASSPDCSSCHNNPILKSSWKSIHPFYRNVAHRHATCPKWETAKQTSQTRNSLNNYIWCRAWHIMKISWKSVHSFFYNITNTHESRKLKNRSRIQGVNRKIPKMFQSVHCLMSDLS